MVSKSTIDRLFARIDAIVSRRRSGKGVVVITAPYADREHAVERHLAAHPEDRGATQYILVHTFALDDCIRAKPGGGYG